MAGNSRSRFDLRELSSLKASPKRFFPLDPLLATNPTATARHQFIVLESESPLANILFASCSRCLRHFQGFWATPPPTRTPRALGVHSRTTAPGSMNAMKMTSLRLRLFKLCSKKKCRFRVDVEVLKIEQ